jgi:hypothetical protein
MLMNINRAFGLAFLCAYAFVLINIKKYAPELVVVYNNLFLLPRAYEGFFIIIALPVFGIACLIFPVTLSNNFSPRFGNMYEKSIPPSFVIVIGYLSIIIAVTLWSIFV